MNDEIFFQRFRERICLPNSLPEELTIKLAETELEFRESFKLVHDAYVNNGFMAPRAQGIRMSFFQLLPSTSTIVAKWNDRVIGTVSVYMKNHLTLPLDFDFDTSFYNTPDVRIGEICALAISEDFRFNKQFKTDKYNLMILLVKYLHNYCVEYMGIDILQIAVVPSNALFYKGVLNFKEIEDKTISDQLINGVEVRGYYTSIKNASDFLMKTYGELPADKNLHDFMLLKSFPQNIFPARKFCSSEDPHMNQKCLTSFLSFLMQYHDMSSKEWQILNHVYKDWIADILPVEEKYHYLKSRVSYRHIVKCQTFIYGGKYEEHIFCNILDVTKQGLRIDCKTELLQNKEYFLDIRINKTTVTSVKCKIMRQQGSIYGANVLESTKNWNEFIDHLNTRLLGSMTEEIKQTG